MADSAESLWPPRFDAAIFDFDGTLADTAHLWHEVDEAFLGSRGLEFDPEYPRRLSALGFVAGAQYTIQRYGLKESVEEICDEWNRMGRALYETRVELRPGAEAYIRMLRDRGVPCALATTNDPTVLDAMQRVNVRALFDARVHSVDVERPKDHPDIYLKAAERLGVDPTRCMVFEDILPGIRSAHLAGMTACGVRANDPSQPVREIRVEADVFLDNWEDIPLTDG